MRSRVASSIAPGSARSRWVGNLVALFAGASLVLAFAPFHFWPTAIFAPAVLLALIYRQAPGRAFRLGWFFGVGQFGFGVSWVYESFTLFGGIVAPAAVGVTALFVGGLAFYVAVAAWLTARIARGANDTPIAYTVWAMGFLSSWVLVEMLRGWLFGGFPWLNLGISQVDGPLVGWLPLAGEYGLTAMLLLLSSMLLLVVRRVRANGWSWRHWALPAVVLVGVPGASLSLQAVSWTSPTGEPLTVGLAQGNVVQMQKFDPAFFDRTLDIYRGLTQAMPEVDLVVWPETAIPRVIEDLPALRADLEHMAGENDFRLVVGTFSRDAAGRYFNALVGIPAEVGDYRKRHLVPFGEFFPLRGLIEMMPWLFEVPMSDLSPGPADQAPLMVGDLRLGGSICFEADFSRDIRPSLPQAAILLTVSNDSWFGDSFSPHQHLQMARARAIEFERPVIRATNTGISATIDAEGRVRKHLASGVRGILVDEVAPRQGSTPLVHYGAWPVLGLMIVLLLIAGLLAQTRRRVQPGK